MDRDDDLARLVGGWVDGMKTESSGDSEGWYDFVIVSGDRRHLVDRGWCFPTRVFTETKTKKLMRFMPVGRGEIDRADLMRLQGILPTVCYPQGLEDCLSTAIPLSFFRFAASHSNSTYHHPAKDTQRTNEPILCFSVLSPTSNGDDLPRPYT